MKPYIHVLVWVLISSSLTEKRFCWYQHACHCLCSINHKHTPWSVASPQAQPSYLFSCAGSYQKDLKNSATSRLLEQTKPVYSEFVTLTLASWWLIYVIHLIMAFRLSVVTEPMKLFKNYTNQFLIISHPHFPAHFPFSPTETPHVPVTPEPASFSSLGCKVILFSVTTLWSSLPVLLEASFSMTTVIIPKVSLLQMQTQHITYCPLLWVTKFLNYKPWPS